MYIVGLISSLLMGLSLGIMGAGGSIMTVPILIYFFKEAPLSATTESLLIVGITAAIGTVLNYKNKLINIKVGTIFALPSFVGVFVSRKIILPNISEIIFELNGFQMTKSILVLFAFAALMIFAALAMIRSGSKKSETTDNQTQKIFLVAIKGVFVGIVTGFVGAGGGFLIIPALTLSLKMPMKNAVATSLAIISINALFGFLISYNQVDISWTNVFSVSLLSVLGLFIGKKVSSGLNENKLKIGFGYFVLITGASIIISELFKI